MMNITILGWYGTETIGDRAILAGIFNLLSEVTDEYNIKLGSLYPEFSRRTLIEDSSFYKQISSCYLKQIELFDSLSIKELRRAIIWSDIVIIGGGPLMAITQMYMLRYAFDYAKKKGVKTAIIGCGWGPLKLKEYVKVANSIVSHSDLTIFRDFTSLTEYNNNAFGKANKSVLSAIDPAIFCAEYYRQQPPHAAEDKYIAINFRDISNDQYGGDSLKNEQLFVSILKSMLDQYNMPMHLIPMHTFYIGGDDRSLLNKIAFTLRDNRIKVHNNPPTLSQVMDLYRDAEFCIGMRFHSILLQTILNGKNIILDYTDPQKGKIIGLMKEIGIDANDKSRYISLHAASSLDFPMVVPEKIDVKDSTIEWYKNQYVTHLKALLGI